MTFFVLPRAVRVDCQPCRFGLLHLLLVRQGVKPKSLQGADRRSVVIAGNFVNVCEHRIKSRSATGLRHLLIIFIARALSQCDSQPNASRSSDRDINVKLGRISTEKWSDDLAAKTVGRPTLSSSYSFEVSMQQCKERRSGARFPASVAY